MNENNPSLEEILFDLAVQRPTAAERAAFLDGACRDNPAVRAQLEELLEAHFGGAGFLPKAPAQDDELPVTALATPLEESPAQMLGRYKLLEKIGEGGFGDLFIKVCQAIQHAHQKGIIHRDIKPSNILVTLHDGVPVPKVIDFGIAKATQQELTDKTVYTQLNQFIGTPAYMSPEQAEMSGLDIDTRSDIYSLGVLMYGLLVGQTPLDAKEMLAAGLDEIRRIICEQEPVRPSTRVSSLQ